MRHLWAHPYAIMDGEDDMERTLISEIFADPKSFDKVQVTVGGWIRTLRAQKTFGFIELNDGSYFKSLQVVFEDGILDNYKDIA